MSEITLLYADIISGKLPKDVKRTIQFLVLQINRHSPKMNYNVHSANVCAFCWDMVYILCGMQLD